MCVWYSLSNIQYHVDLFFDSSKRMNFVTFRWKNNVEHFLCNLYKLEWKFGAAQEIWVLIAPGKCIFNHPYWCSRDIVLKYGPCLHLHTYSVYKSSKCYFVSNYTFSQDRLVLHCSALGYEPKSNVLAHLIYYLFTIYNQFSLLWNVQRTNFVLFVCLLYVQSQQLWSLWDGQFT